MRQLPSDAILKAWANRGAGFLPSSSPPTERRQRSYETHQGNLSGGRCGGDADGDGRSCHGADLGGGSVDVEDCRLVWIPEWEDWFLICELD